MGRLWTDGVRRIGTDEVGYRTGHRNQTVVIDRNGGKLVWAAQDAMFPVDASLLIRC